jgi:hypothetical protein
MMFVTAFVVKPRGGISDVFSLRVIRASGPLKIPCTNPKLRNGILGKVMGKTLPVKTNPETTFGN